MYILFKIIHWFVALIGVFGVLFLVPFVIFGTVLLTRSSNEVDAAKKKTKRKMGIFLIIMPFVMIIGSLILSLIFAVIKAAVGI